MALAGVGVIALTVGTGTMGDADAVAAERARVVLGATAPVLTGVAQTPWPLVAVAAGALVAAGGGLIAVRGRRWVELGRRYESPAGAPAPDRDPRERRLWDALDRGEDPTS